VKTLNIISASSYTATWLTLLFLQGLQLESQWQRSHFGSRSPRFSDSCDFTLENSWAYVNVLNPYAIQKQNAIHTIVSLRMRSYPIFVNTVNRNMIVVRKRNGNFFLITTVLKDQQDLSRIC